LVPEVLEKALCVLHDPLWAGFGPTFARDKLQECYGFGVSKETLRKLMHQTELWRPGHAGVPHRRWRERRAGLGMLVQLDGSDHDWFEGRGPRCVLLLYIDDATSRILYAQFVNVEDTLTLMRVTWDYLKRWGRPGAFYVDRDSIYKVNRRRDGDEDGELPMTQFTRAMSELGIEVISANSPQAKGRVERGFNTLQDRLVKELRLRGISEIPEANLFLWGAYIADHNARFSVAPAVAADTHRPLLPSHRLDQILSLRIERTVMNDFTVRHENKFLQVSEIQPVRVRPGDKVQVEQRLDGTTHLRCKDGYLNFKPIPQRPYRPLLVAQPSRAKPQPDHRVKGVGSRPGPNHPWRRLFAQGPYRSAYQLSAYYAE
jgi:hypothetical protein